MILTLPTTAWDTVATHAFNRKVLMIGVEAGGYDVVALAHVARIVIAYPARGQEFKEDQRHAEAILKTAREQGAEASLIVRTAPWETSGYGYWFGSFDLAVINPAAYPTDALDMLISEAAGYARVITILEPAGANLFDTVTSVMYDLDYEVSAEGPVITAVPKRTEPTGGER